MRYYFINHDSEDFFIDVEIYSNKRMVFNHQGMKKEVFVKSLAGKNYYSLDGIKWKKLPLLEMNESLVSHADIFKVFRGYRPSGLNKGSAGALLTQMPGKVVKLMKREGDKISKGETILILEAMKMENEIKSSTDGIIKNINVKEGQALEAGFLMVEIES